MRTAHRTAMPLATRLAAGPGPLSNPALRTQRTLRRHSRATRSGISPNALDSQQTQHVRCNHHSSTSAAQHQTQHSSQQQGSSCSAHSTAELYRSIQRQRSARSIASAADRRQQQHGQSQQCNNVATQHRSRSSKSPATIKPRPGPAFLATSGRLFAA